MSVLDAGCGPGILAAYLLAHDAEITAFDVNPKMLELARLRAGLRARMFLVDLFLPLPAFQRQGVRRCGVAGDGYVRDWSVPLPEFQRVLKRGGRVVFTVLDPLSAYLTYRRRSAFGGHTSKRFGMGLDVRR